MCMNRLPKNIQTVELFEKTGSMEVGKADLVLLHDKLTVLATYIDGICKNKENSIMNIRILHLIEGAKQAKGVTDRIEHLKTTHGAKFFDPAQQSVFPESDFHLCTAVDKFDFVLRVDKREDGLMAVNKIPV